MHSWGGCKGKIEGRGCWPRRSAAGHLAFQREVSRWSRTPRAGTWTTGSETVGSGLTSTEAIITNDSLINLKLSWDEARKESTYWRRARCPWRSRRDGVGVEWSESCRRAAATRAARLRERSHWRAAAAGSGGRSRWCCASCAGTPRQSSRAPDWAPLQVMLAAQENNAGSPPAASGRSWCGAQGTPRSPAIDCNREALQCKYHNRTAQYSMTTRQCPFAYTRYVRVYVVFKVANSI